MKTVLSEKKDNLQSTTLQFEVVDYSEKAIALFGDTKEIKDLLKAMGGKFNPRLTYNGGKRAGWIFTQSKRGELNTRATGTSVCLISAIIHHLPVLPMTI